MNEQDGSPLRESSFTATGLASLSETNLSRVASKLVKRAVDKTYNGLTHAKRRSGDGPLEQTENEATSSKSPRKTSLDAGSEPSPNSLTVNNQIELSEEFGSKESSFKDFDLRKGSADLMNYRHSFSGSAISEPEPRERTENLTVDTEDAGGTMPLLFPTAVGGISVHPSDSTQVIVPINPMPEESQSRVGRSQEVKEHLTQIPSATESLMVNHLVIHRNEGSIDLGNVIPDNSIVKIEQEEYGGPIGGGPSEEEEPAHTAVGLGDTGEALGGGGRVPGEEVVEAPREAGKDIGKAGAVREGAGEVLGEDFVEILGAARTFNNADAITPSQRFASLIDEMASEVAKSALEGIEACDSRGILQDIYRKFSEVAKMAAKITADSRRGYGCECDTHPASTATATRDNNSGGVRRQRLPSEVREHILRTLSDIKTQLDRVKSQIRK